MNFTQEQLDNTNINLQIKLGDLFVILTALQELKIKDGLRAYNASLACLNNTQNNGWEVQTEKQPKEKSK